MTNKRQEALVPCPFCGGDAAYFDGIDRENNKTASVVCLSCGAKVWRGDEVREEAIKTWNTRVALEQPTITVEMLEGMKRAVKHPQQIPEARAHNEAIDAVIALLKGEK